TLCRHPPDDARLPKRPIAALRGLETGSPPTLGLGMLALRTGGRGHDLARYFAELESVPMCDADANTGELPADCLEQAATPADLFRKLDEWGHDALVIP